MTLISEKKSLSVDLGLEYIQAAHYQLTPAELIEEALTKKEGVLSQEGALVCRTGEFTGRSPKDRFIVKDELTQETVWWGATNTPITPACFQGIYQKMKQCLQEKKVYIRSAYASASPTYRLPIRTITTVAWHDLFCHHLFLRPTEEELPDFVPQFTIMNVPDFQADPAIDGTRQANFTIINFKERVILIGGTGYAGEMKKSIFTVLNYLLPQNHGVLPMHCAANKGTDGDTAIFFGLSGTGKTTLSADAQRCLIGDDEHGWDDQGIFNFEGGCYAKTINLSPEREPHISQAIKWGTILENVHFKPGTRVVDYADASITPNTRAAYPIHHIPSAVIPSVGDTPRHIFFLTCDAHGVLPPIAKLNKAQAMYHFLSGYTAKVAGTEVGVMTPQSVFSACFGLAFLPLHPIQYATMLGQRMTAHPVSVWLVNTGWVGGGYGVGERIQLAYTRAMITAALAGDLDQAVYTAHPTFGIAIPHACPHVPATLLDPSATWKDQQAYQQAVQQLAQAFADNFKQYADRTTPEICAGGPISYQ